MFQKEEASLLMRRRLDAPQTSHERPGAQLGVPHLSMDTEPNQPGKMPNWKETFRGWLPPRLIRCH